jgi:hypothetical protein
MSQFVDQSFVDELENEDFLIESMSKPTAKWIDQGD